jgi:RNA polymerase sigma factor (TIGR02999 family)
MTTVPSNDITGLLIAWSAGDKDALNDLMPLVQQELHRLAARYMLSERPDHTLQTTALVNEAYCKLIDQNNVNLRDRGHFFALAGQFMRRILIDHAKSRSRTKRGSSPTKISLDEALFIPEQQAEELILIDKALTRLAEFDPLKSRIVEMKFFGGSTTEEIAEVEKLSTRTIQREWRKAKAWLFNAMRQ